MQKLFEAAGYELAEEISAADIVVVNTCTVTAVSSQKSRQMIRRAAKENCVLVVVGCYAQSALPILSLSRRRLIGGRKFYKSATLRRLGSLRNCHIRRTEREPSLRLRTVAIIFVRIA
mgnify:CR=1 FL=1